MLGYITKQFQKYQHEISKHPQHAPYPSAPKKYGVAAQEPIKKYDTKPAGPKGIKRVQKIVVIINYYARSVDPITLMTLSTLASKQPKATEKQYIISANYLIT